MAISSDPLANEAAALLERMQAESARTMPELLHGLANVRFHAARLVETRVLSAQAAFEACELASSLHRLLRARQDRSRVDHELGQVLDEMLETLCHDIGFERTMAFRVGGRHLDVAATRFVQDGEWAEEVHSLAALEPPQLVFDLLESAVVDAQHKVVVADPQHDRRTWRPIVESTKTSSYVAAPIVVDGKTIAVVHADRWFSGRQVTEHDRDLLALVAAEGSIRASNLVVLPTLSARQQQVMELVAEGATTIQVASCLCVSPETIKTHLKNIYAELGVTNRTQAAQAFRARW